MLTAEEMTKRIEEREAQTLRDKMYPDEAETVTAGGGESWKWQLRDSQGQWIQMGSKVKWMDKGKSRSGKIVGSPKAGTAEVEDDEGNRHILTTNRLTATEAPTQDAVEPKQVKAGVKKFTSSAKADAAAKSIAEDIDADVEPKNRRAAVKAVGEYVAGTIGGKLPAEMRNLPAVMAIRVRGQAALKRLRTFTTTSERFEKIKAKAEIWADEFVTETLHAEGNRPGLWTAFHTLHIPSPFKHPVEFLDYAQEHITQAVLEHGGSAVDAIGQAVSLLSSGKKIVAMAAKIAQHEAYDKAQGRLREARGF